MEGNVKKKLSKKRYNYYFDARVSTRVVK